LEEKFASFSSTSPAWAQLSEFALQHGFQGNEEAVLPAGPISQENAFGTSRLDVIVGGYCANKASVLERRHELISLANKWSDDRERLAKLVDIGLKARDSLLDAAFASAFGLPGMASIGLLRKKKGRKAIRLRKDAQGLHDHAEKLFYARTESLIHATFSSEATFREWGEKRREYARQIVQHCRDIFEELTQPYAMKPELIPVIAWSRRALNTDLKKLMEETS